MRESPVTLDDIVAAAGAAARIGGARGERLVAAAWLMRNRARQAAAFRKMRAETRFGDGTLSAAAASVLREIGAARRQPSARALLRAGGAVCAVLAGDLPDPLGGAVELAAVRVA